MNDLNLDPRLPHYQLSSAILGSCFEVINELGIGFQAQVINYLAASNLPVGLLVNFNNKQLDYKRLHHPIHHPAAEGDPAYPVIS